MLMRDKYNGKGILYKNSIVTTKTAFIVINFSFIWNLFYHVNALSITLFHSF
jgi:hypothetical protein